MKLHFERKRIILAIPAAVLAVLICVTLFPSQNIFAQNSDCDQDVINEDRFRIIGETFGDICDANFTVTIDHEDPGSGITGWISDRITDEQDATGFVIRNSNPGSEESRWVIYDDETKKYRDGDVEWLVFWGGETIMLVRPENPTVGYLIKKGDLPGTFNKNPYAYEEIENKAFLVPLGGLTADLSQTFEGFGIVGAPIVDTDTYQLQASLIITNEEGAIRDRTFGPVNFTFSENSNAVSAPSYREIAPSQKGGGTSPLQFTVSVREPVERPGSWKICATNINEIAAEVEKFTTLEVNVFDECQNIPYQEGDNLTSAVFTLVTGDSTPAADRHFCSGVWEGWIVCPIITAIYDTLNFVYNQLFTSLLVVEPLSTTGDNLLYQAWSNVRILSNILFIFIFMIAIIGQTFSWFFTPYELKKILPRIVIGVIAIQLSWYFAGFLIDLFNVLGAGVKDLVTTPVANTPSIEKAIFLAPSETTDATGYAFEGLALYLFGEAVIGGAAFFGSTSGLLLTLPIILFPLLMALIVTVIILLIRQVFIAIMAVLSPIAIAMWILPGTDKITKAWAGLFAQALIIYPLLVGAIAIGDLAARVMTGVNYVDQSTLIKLMSVGVFFSPFFLAPALVRVAGGFLGSAIGGMDNMQRGLSDRIFGDMNDPGSYRATARNKRSAGRATFNFKQVKKFEKLRDNRKKVIDDKDSSHAKKLVARAKYRALAVQPGALRNFYRTNMRPNYSIDLTRRTKNAKQFVDTVQNNGDDSPLWAYFHKDGRHPITGEEFSAVDMNFAKQYAGDLQMGQAIMSYLVYKAVSPVILQQMMNMFAEDPRFADGFRVGMWKGTGFANQGKHRHLKNTSLTDGNDKVTHQSAAYVKSFLTNANGEGESKEYAHKDFRRWIASEVGVPEQQLDNWLDQDDNAQHVAENYFRGKINDGTMYDVWREQVDNLTKSKDNANHSEALWQANDATQFRLHEVIEKGVHFTRNDKGRLQVAGSGIEQKPNESEERFKERVADHILYLGELRKTAIDLVSGGRDEIDDESPIQDQAADAASVRALAQPWRDSSINADIERANVTLVQEAQRQGAASAGQSFVELVQNGTIPIEKVKEQYVQARIKEIAQNPRLSPQERQQVATTKGTRLMESMRGVTDMHDLTKVIQRLNIEDNLSISDNPTMSAGAIQGAVNFIRRSEWVHDPQVLRDIQAQSDSDFTFATRKDIKNGTLGARGVTSPESSLEAIERLTRL